MKPRLLDLFCGAGGAGMGYHRAGFEVVGVDINSQPNYPFEFHQADALIWPLEGFDAIHASPPCQAFSDLRHRTDGEYPDLVAATRERLLLTGVPYVIENVEGAPLINPVRLCGSAFGLGANGRQLRRHRLFESNVPIMVPSCQHRGQPVGVYGTGGGGQMTRGYKGTPEEYREAMEIDWATRAEIAQAIPPIYAEFIGGYLMGALKRLVAA
jgi:DNA (cytosine-5)-methyltransferase 1